MILAGEGTSNRKYTTAIIKGGLMEQEIKCLLRHWHPGEPLHTFAKRVHENGFLGHSTAQRTNDVVRRVFARRLLRPSDRPACLLGRVLMSRLPGHVFTELLFVYAARRDALIYDFTRKCYWPKVREGRTVLDTEDVIAFIMDAIAAGKVNAHWSESVIKRVAIGILCILRDVGFVKCVRNRRKEITRYYMSEEGTAILARELHESGVTDSALCSHPDWGLFGLSAAEVLERLDRLGEHRGLLVQRAGSVVRFTWFVESIEEMINVLAG